MKVFDFKSGLLIVGAMALLSIASCLKADDPPPAKPNPNLTNHYCNNPNAINYNWGFPGIPDSTVCVFPDDLFKGQWVLTDSIFHADSTFNYAETQTLNFLPTEDSSRSHLKITGFCGNTSFLLATADKYGNAVIDSMNSTTAGQFLCSPNDTAIGEFQIIQPGRDSMQIQLTVTGLSGGYHKGIAKKL